jgi:hypothetical protein
MEKVQKPSNSACLHTYSFTLKTNSVKIIIKSAIFWDITQCSPLKVNRCFGGTCRLHFQDWKSRALLAAWFLLLAWLLNRSRRLHFRRKCRLTFNGHYIPEDRTLHNHRLENLRFHKTIIILEYIIKREENMISLTQDVNCRPSISRVVPYETTYNTTRLAVVSGIAITSPYMHTF